jgi:hypothetical protein
MAVDLEYFGVPPSDAVQLGNRTRLTASAGQTTFPAPYSVGYVDVYFNGAKLDAFTEFTATDGANVVLSAAATAGDIVEVISQARVSVANTYTQQQVNALTSMYYGVCTGTGDAQVLVTSPVFTAYSDGMMVRCRAAGQNLTTTPTIAVNGLAAVTIVSNNGNAALYGKDFAQNNELTLRYVQSINRFVLVDGGSTQQVPVQFDNTNQIATTSFVQRALGNFANVVSYSATATQPITDIGCVVKLTGTSNFTLTLPSTTGLPIGASIVYENTGTGIITLSGNFYTLGTGTSSSIAIGFSQSIQAVWDGSNWNIIGGFGGYSFASSGYQRLPSGLIIQWGSSNVPASSSVTVTLPIAFPNSNYITLATDIGSSSYSYGANGSGLSQIIIYKASANPGTAYWITIGH